MQRLTLEFLDGFDGLLVDVYPLESGVAVDINLPLFQGDLISSGFRLYYVDVEESPGYYRLLVRSDDTPVLQTVVNITAETGTFATGFILPDASDVRFGVDRGDGTPGTLVPTAPTRPVGSETGGLLPVFTIDQRVELLSLTSRPTGRFGTLVAIAADGYCTVATDDNKTVYVPSSRLKPVYSQVFA